ncbi:MAG: DUF58 domain-containing protein, partial [Propionibacteriaceae bacterium]|nr:DUF58 domain-containing protein [Propionibacteriaceae bacterium]
MSRIDFEPPVALLSAAEETPGEAPDERPIIERESFRAQLAAWWASTLRVREQIWVVLGPVWRAIKLVARSITGLGWTTLFVGIWAWVAAWAFGWVEAVYAAIFCLVALCLGALFTIGRTNIEVTMALTPQRIRVGQSSVASFQVTNLAHRRIGSLSVRLPVGETAARFVPPTLHRGETHEDWVSIPATKRGVIPIGPIYTDRDDPFGLVRRELRWTDVTELFVHPEIVALDTLGSGILRDLEGQSTPNVSSADLAFHALRDYVTGDDMRHIHWKSSARLSSITGDDRFMVRQFLDTRRTHIGLLSDLNASHYADDDEFEVALSCAASIVARALMDDMDITIICGKEVVERPKSRYALDC